MEAIVYVPKNITISFVGTYIIVPSIVDPLYVTALLLINLHTTTHNPFNHPQLQLLFPP